MSENVPIIVAPKFTVEVTAIRGEDPHLVVKLATNGLALAWRVTMGNTMRGIADLVVRTWRETVPEIDSFELAGLEASLLGELRRIWTDDYHHVRVMMDHGDVVSGLTLVATARSLGL